MRLKDKIKNYGFWMSLTAAVILVLQTIGETVGFVIDDEAIVSIMASVCGMFVVLGIISNPESGSGYLDYPEEKIDDITK